MCVFFKKYGQSFNKNFKCKPGISFISFSLSRPLLQMRSTHSFSKITFFSAFSSLTEEPLSMLV